MAGLVEELQTEAISDDICSAMSANLQITRHHEGQIDGFGDSGGLIRL